MALVEVFAKFDPFGLIPGYCFRMMLFLTARTPSTLLAKLSALLISSLEFAKPLNCTVPLKVSTLIAVALTIESSNSLAFTFAVIAESSIS